MVNKCDVVSTNVLTHQQVELVQVGHDDCTVPPLYHIASPRVALRAGMSGPELIE
jgi:hypothetical protein